MRKFLIVQTEGSRQVKPLVGFYSLDMILATGYRVRSHRGVQFRRWATEKGSIPCGRQVGSCKIQSPPPCMIIYPIRISLKLSVHPIVR
ncbi:RhuM family protein [Methanothrix sp.]|uniref:RhuM family protein n=1 Tax=Methanothrix sp. TaxID=90426 RepID=UPI003C756783